MRMALPNGSRRAKSVPYGCSVGSWVMSAPDSTILSKVAWTSSVVISARVAPNQAPGEAYRALRAHLLAKAPFGAELTFSEVDLGEGFLAGEGWATEQARSALREGYGVAPVDLGVGGSIPFIADLAREFPEAAILVTAVLDPQGSPHSPNESLHLETFEHAILAEALLLAGLADS